ncbi:hypothetical protein MMPV_000134 [Pyropia vietnamensis]
MGCRATAIALAGFAAAVIVAAATVPAVLAAEDDGLAWPGSCDSLLSAYRTEAAARVSARGVTGLFDTSGGRALFAASPAGGRRISREPGIEGADISSTVVTNGAESSPVAGTDFSDTNVQVEGVAEPDIVKTDGKRVFVLRSRTLSVIKVSEGGETGTVSGSVAIDGHSPTEMFLDGDGDQLLLLGNTYGSGLWPIEGEHPTRSVSNLRRFPGRSITVLTLVDVSDWASPRVVATFRADGRYVAARRVGGTVRLVLSSRATGRVRWVYPGWREPRTDTLEGTAPAGPGLTAEAAATENKRRIEATTLDDWVPSYRVTTPTGESASAYLVNCDSVFRPFRFGGFSSLSVLTFDLRKGEGRAKDNALGRLTPVGGVAVQADGRTVYATETSLYVATTDYQFDVVGSRADSGGSAPGAGEATDSSVAPPVSRTFVTRVHQFDLTSTAATYTGSGAVPGSVLNQFSFHAYKGTLFVATTEGSPWGAARDTSFSTVSALQPTDSGSLSVVGSVSDLGVGERIFAVRYVADTAYVVTFRRTDPLYVISLADPTAPARVGELKIPGFSSYLHPLGPGRLLGVGQNATAEGVATAAQVTLFSVEDPANPRKLASWTDTPTSNGDSDGGRRRGTSSSTVGWDHRAFLYWAPSSTAVLPLSGYGVRRFTGALVLTVGNDSLTEAGRLSHPDGSAVVRNWVIGKDHLWSLSRSTVVVNALDGLAQEGQLDLPSSRDGGNTKPIWKTLPVAEAAA